ncbi:MAG: DUF2721 domain-containing protein [Cytophagaceae bacterium]
MEKLSVVTNILSAMITPAVLILACGSIILTTSQRLGTSIERTRKLNDLIDRLQKDQNNKDYTNRMEYLFYQLKQAAHRAKLLQQALASLYMAISSFVATSLFIGIFEIINLNMPWLPLVFGVVGSLLLFYATILLIYESRIALYAVGHEMKNTLQVNRKYVNNK